MGKVVGVIVGGKLKEGDIAKNLKPVLESARRLTKNHNEARAKTLEEMDKDNNELLNKKDKER